MTLLKPLFFIFVLQLFSVSVVMANDLPLFSKIYDDSRDPSADAKAAIALAANTNRHVLIEIGGNWCGWCKKMDAFFEQNPDVYQALHQTFVLLKVNVSDSNENEAFMAAMPPVLGYPLMYVSTGKGKLVLSKDTADFLENGDYSRDAFLRFFEHWQQQTRADKEKS